MERGYKKHRGLKRYYQKLSIENIFEKIFWLDLNHTVRLNLGDPDSWPRGQHFHFDWRGYGNDSFRRRKPHLDNLFRHFDILTERTKDLTSEFHICAILLDFESYSDALYLHKPGNDYFTFKISDLQPTTTLTNKSLNEYIDQLVDYKKLYGNADEAFCLLYKENIGVPFE